MKPNVLLAAMIVAPVPAFAQEDPAELEPIVVSASRTAVPAERLGVSITVIDRETIEQRQVRFLGELLREVPGVSVAQSGGIGTQTQVRIRGAEANQVLVLIDGVQANDPALGDEFSFAHLLLNSVERVEVVRGPHSAIWGSDSLAGVINIVTRTESRSTRDAYVEAGSNSTFMGGASFGLTGERGHVRVSADYLDSDGTNISRVGSEDDGYQNVTIGFQGRFEFSDSLTLSSTLRNIDSESDYDSIDFFSTGLPIDGTAYTEAEQLTFGSQLNWDQGRILHRFDLRYSDTSNANFDFGAQLSRSTADILSFGYQGTVDVAPDSALDHRVTFAVEREDTDFSQRGEASPFGDPNQDRSIDVTSATIEYLGEINGALALAASVRHDDNSDFDSKTSYRLSLTQRVGESARVWAAYGTGQKQPTFIERFGFFTSGFVGNPDLRPEQSKGWEIGVESDLLDGQLNVSLAAFAEDLEDEINGFFFDPSTFSFTAVNVAGDSKRQGAEAGLRWNISDGISVNASYAYIDTTQPDSTGQLRDELRRPRHSGYFGVNYVADAVPLSVNLSAAYNGERFDRFFPPFPQPSQRVVLDDYWLVNVAARYRISESLEATLRAENLLDDDYEDVFGFANPGRTVFAGLQVRY